MLVNQIKIKMLRLGRLVKMFVLADLFLLGGWGLIQPVFALFVIERIAGATVVTVGMAAAVYWLLKAVFQLPIAAFIDKKAGEKDDFIMLTTALVIVSFSAFAYTLIDRIWQLYLVQMIHALAFSMYTPSWAAIFSRHLDKGHEAVDWSFDNSTLSLAAGLAGLASGIFVQWFGFTVVFVLVSAMSLISAFIIFSTPKIAFPGEPRQGRKRITDKKPISSVPH